MNINFYPHFVRSTNELHSLVKDGIESKTNHYYFITNTWGDTSKVLMDSIIRLSGTTRLNVIDIFDIPNALQVIKSVIKEEKNIVSVPSLNEAQVVPCLIVVHGSYPRVVTYPGAFYSELGMV